MKEGRDFEHFEPLGTQTAETRREWILQGKGQDLPYCIETLEVFPEKRCVIRKDDSCTGVEVCYEFEKPVKEWDEYNPYVYELTVKILRGGQLLCEQTSHFGFRDFSHRELTLYCNDREIFLRGTHDGMIFPLTDMRRWIWIRGSISME